MRRSSSLLIGVVAFASGVMLGFKLDSDETDAPPRRRAAFRPRSRRLVPSCWPQRSRATTRRFAELIPATVSSTRSAVPSKAARLRTGRSSSDTTDERPLEALAAILKMPYVLSRGYYYWPWAYAVESSSDLSQHEVELLAPLGPPSELLPGRSRLLRLAGGHRARRHLVFFVAGD